MIHPLSTHRTNVTPETSRSGHSTLIVDLDPQSSATYFFGVKPRIKRGARGLTEAAKAIRSSIKSTEHALLDVLPADMSHRRLQLEFHAAKRSRRRLANSLKPLLLEYDLVILDCPPTLDLVAENVFDAADVLLVPVVPTTLSLRSHRDLHDFLDRKRYRSVRVHSFLSMVDGRKKMHRDVAGVVREEFAGQLLRTAIPLLAQIEKMALRQEPLPAYSRRSRAAIAFRSLWREVEDRLFGLPGA